MQNRSYVKMWEIPCRVEVCAKTSMDGGWRVSISSFSTLRSIVTAQQARFECQSHKRKETKAVFIHPWRKLPLWTGANVQITTLGLGVVWSPSLMHTKWKTLWAPAALLKSQTSSSCKQKWWISHKAGKQGWLKNACNQEKKVHDSDAYSLGCTKAKKRVGKVSHRPAKSLVDFKSSEERIIVARRQELTRGAKREIILLTLQLIY